VALALIARHPLAGGLDSDAEASSDHGEALAFRYNTTNKLGSTMRRQAGILMDVHPVPPWILKSRNSSFLAQDWMDNLMKAHI
jgi:hypothetical protein